MSGAVADPPPLEPARLQWPYKHLWNVLRGESILADDDVILEELRLSYEQIVQALTQFKVRPTDQKRNTGTVKATEATAPTPSTGAAASATPIPPTTDGEGSKTATTTSATTTGQSAETESNEAKLRSRISVYLELEESVAWELFCSFIMFEYKGGSTTFQKLLEAPRVSTEFLTDLKAYYHNERICAILCIQALFGHLDDSEHKYYHIFRAFCEWTDEPQNGVSLLTENLIKSLDLATNDQEQVETLHALLLLTFQMPHVSLVPFCKAFKGFKPGRKEEKVVLAESALMYGVLLQIGLHQGEEEEVPPEYKQALQQMVLEHGADILLNRFSLGAVLGFYCKFKEKDPRVQRLLMGCIHPPKNCMKDMVHIAKAYSKYHVQNRHNLPTAALKGLHYAAESFFDHLDQAIPKFGEQSDYLEFIIAILDHTDVASKLLLSDTDLLDLVQTAVSQFPIDLKYMLGIWGSMCATCRSPDDCVQMLHDCLRMLTTLKEHITDFEFLYPSYINRNMYQTPISRNVAGILLPPGTEATFTPEEEGSGSGRLGELVWILKDQLPLSPFVIIYHLIIAPVIHKLESDKNNVPMLVEGVSVSDVLWVDDEKTRNNIQSIYDFLMRFAQVSNAITSDLYHLLEPMAFLMFKTIDFLPTIQRKAEVVANLANLVDASLKFGSAENCNDWMRAYYRLVWPNVAESTSLISDIIMGYESVASNDCKVTLALLKSVSGFLKEEVINNPGERGRGYNSILFINDNVFHSFTRWRMESEEVKFKVLLGCLKVYNRLFSIDNGEPGSGVNIVGRQQWQALKGSCVRNLLSSNSSLMAALSTDDDQLQSSVIKPTKDNYLVPEIIYESLSLLLKLFKFQRRSIKMVDASLGSTLVQKLGKFARHRLDYKIPTLAMALLKQIAEELNMSLLSCFGSDEVAFRDLILQRLEFRSEDVNLKVAILDFLTIAAHTQPGLIQYIFMDDFLAQKIVELPTEKDEGLALSVLCFIRALIRKGATVMKRCANFWENVFIPSRNLQKGGRLKIITCTLNIASMELYHYGLVNPKFALEIKSLLKQVELVRLFELAMSEPTNPLGTECLLAFKHFISVVLHRNDLHDSFIEETRRELLEIVTVQFWFNQEGQEKDVLAASTTMVQLMCQLSASLVENPAYLHDLSQRIPENFFINTNISVQISTLALLQECLRKATQEIDPSVVENVLRVIHRIMINAIKIFQVEEDMQIEVVQQILTLAAGIVFTVMKSECCKGWEMLFRKNMVADDLVHVVNLGITLSKGPDILLECLNVMIRMAEHHSCAEMLLYSKLVDKVFIPVSRFAELSVSENKMDIPGSSYLLDSLSSTWTKVYLLCLELQTQMLRTEENWFLESSLNFWGVHGTHLVQKLFSLPGMTNECKINNPEHNFKLMRNLLTFNVFTLDGISALVPFFGLLEVDKAVKHLKIMSAVFMSLQTSLNLLDQPQYMQSFFSINTHAKPYTESRLSPQLMELQSKLWDMIYLCCHIFWKLRRDPADNEAMLVTVNRVAQACIKGLTKPERRGHASGSGSGGGSHHHATGSRLLQTLERSLCLFYQYGKQALETPQLSPKQVQTLTRELANDVVTICDGVRRISGTNGSQFLDEMCSTLENTFNIPQQVELTRDEHARNEVLKQLKYLGLGSNKRQRSIAVDSPVLPEKQGCYQTTPVQMVSRAKPMCVPYGDHLEGWDLVDSQRLMSDLMRSDVDLGMREWSVTNLPSPLPWIKTVMDGFECDE